jgi:hypothetical protein
MDDPAQDAQARAARPVFFLAFAESARVGAAGSCKAGPIPEVTRSYTPYW